MSGPDGIPPGSWGGDLADGPNNPAARAQFEATLQAQTERIAKLAAAAPAVAAGVQVIDRMPGNELSIPAPGQEGTHGAPAGPTVSAQPQPQPEQDMI